MDGMSLCMAVGSPALITYSLTLTFLNRKWARDEFDRLKMGVRDVSSRYPELDRRIQAIVYVIEEAQQVPLRVSQEYGWLSSLIVNGHNHDRWIRLRETLSYTRRKSSLALVFQMIVAIIAWLFTVIPSIVSSLGDVDTRLETATGDIWLWMIPIIWGWVLVGTQTRRRAVDDALGAEHATNALWPPTATEPTVSRGRNQRGLLVQDRESGLTPFPSREWPFGNGSQIDQPFCYDLRGFERELGPLFNYARIFTYRHMISTVLKAIRRSLDQMRDHKTVAGHEWSPDHTFQSQLEGNVQQTDAYCGLDHHQIWAYPEWSVSATSVLQALAQR